MALLTWAILGGAGISKVLSAQTGSVDIATSIGFLLFGSLSVFSYSNFYQLIYAAKNKCSASIGIASAVIPIITIATLLLVVGMYMFTQDPHLDAGLVFLEALGKHLSTGMLPIGIVLFFAGLMSSADTNIYGIASHYILSKKDNLNPVKNIRKAVIIVGAISLIIGYIFRDVIDTTLFAVALSMVPSISMIYLIAGGCNKYRFIGSIVGGTVGLIIGLIIFGLTPNLIIFIIIGELLGLAYNGKWLKI